MKFEDLLMQKDETSQKRLVLEEEVEKLEGVLENEKRLNGVMRQTLRGSRVSRTCLSFSLPLQVQVLLAELAMVEEEITWLERKVEELKTFLHQEKKHTRQLQWQVHHHRPRRSRSGRQKENHKDDRDVMKDPKLEFTSHKKKERKNSSLGSISEINIHNKSEKAETSSGHFEETKEHLVEKSNKLSEELITCLIKTFHKLHMSSSRSDSELSVFTPKLGLSCIKSNCKTLINNSDGIIPMINSYSMLPDTNATTRTTGPYRRFIQFTERSLDITHVSHCVPEIKRLRMLMDELSSVNVGCLTYKQKLAFWINIYNACIMQAFLQHEVPQTQVKILDLLNKAMVNVGGVVLNALAIEHFILRHRYNHSKRCMVDEEKLLRHAYGISYPEPNVIFALCRGSWSSPALRVYTGDNVMNELERAKVEYLEASIRITSKKKIMLPKLLHWHMKDFADDTEYLLEWIYSQLPREGSLKRLIMESLLGDSGLGTKGLVEILPYESEFRYLLPP